MTPKLIGAMKHLESRVDFFGVGETEERALVEEFKRMRRVIVWQNEQIESLQKRAVYAEELIMTRGLQPEEPKP